MIDTARRVKLFWVVVLFLCAALCASGCAALGIAANAFPQNVAPKYAGLAGQTVAVMAWADRGLRIDWPTIQLDLASAVQAQLKAQQTSKSKELKDTRFPLEPRSVARYQADHPENEALPVNEFAAQLGVTRLIYVEIEQFSTRSEMAVEMFRGAVSANLKIVEIDPNTKVVRVAYEEANVRAIFPPKSRPEGLPVGRDDVIYTNTIKALAKEIVDRLVTHESEQ
jgi:hypothetical protein